jgi:regulator of cell morphogenesis and NO signaling
MHPASRPIPRLEPEALVNDVLREHPATARVFNAFGIDACCGGARSLRDAAREDGADPSALLAELEWTLAESEDAP